MSSSLLQLAPLAVCGAATAMFVFRASPRLTFVVWTLVLFFVPIWVGVSIGFFWSAITLVTILAILASLADLRLTIADGLVAALAVLLLALFAANAATLSATVIAMLEWLVPFAWGRIVLARVPAGFIVRTIAAVAAAAAILALIEFFTGTNLFVLIPGAGGTDTWASLQLRAGFLRAEGAFGHSIALGASLAMCSAFVVASRWPPPVMLLALAALVGAIVVTFSRIGLVTAALAVGMSVVLLPGLGRWVRWGIGAAAAIAVLAIVPFLGDVFDDAGDEAGGSAEYRTRLLTLATQVQLLGKAGDWSGRTVDGVYLGNFSESIDNTLLLIALRFGWVPTILVVAVLASVLIGMLRRTATPAAIAVVSQLPALVAVALITQFGMLLWFFVGLAVSWSLEDDQAPPGVRGVALTAPHPRPALPSIGGSA